jgi:excisionase family DNA binding protein
MEPVLYTVSETAELLKINRNSVYDLLKHNVIRGLKLGSLKITRDELMRFLENNNGKDLSNLQDIKELTFEK